MFFFWLASATLITYTDGAFLFAVDLTSFHKLRLTNSLHFNIFDDQIWPSLLFMLVNLACGHYHHPHCVTIPSISRKKCPFSIGSSSLPLDELIIFNKAPVLFCQIINARDVN